VTRTRDEALVAEARRLYGQGLTTYAIAARAGVNPRTVQRWLAGATRPPGRRKRPGVRDSLILRLRDGSRPGSRSWPVTTRNAGPALTRRGRGPCRTQRTGHPPGFRGFLRRFQ
jgi:hypothetical protein